MEMIEEVCAVCQTHLLVERTCPNKACSAFGRRATFSSRPPPRRSYQDMVAVPGPEVGRLKATVTEEDDDRPTPIEVPVTPAGVRRPASGMYPVERFDDDPDKASNGES